MESRSLEILRPYLDERYNDRVVLTNKGRLGRFLQETVGDVIVQSGDEMWTFELKAEEEKTGNLFLETWSNKNFDDPEGFARLGANVGWLLKQRADLLLYHFLDVDELYVLRLLALQQWAFGANGRPGKIYRYIEVPQEKYAQKNQTFGRLVPLSTLKAEVGWKLFKPLCGAGEVTDARVQTTQRSFELR